MQARSERTLCCGRSVLAAIGFCAATMIAGASLAAPPADCGETPDGFSAWLNGFRRDAEIAGLPPAVIESALSGATYDPDIIAHDRRQGSFHEDFEKFAAKRVSAYRVRKGRQMLIAYAEPLEKIEHPLWRTGPGPGGDLGVSRRNSGPAPGTYQPSMR